jgi:hypothetical protein
LRRDGLGVSGWLAAAVWLAVEAAGRREGREQWSLAGQGSDGQGEKAAQALSAAFGETAGALFGLDRFYFDVWTFRQPPAMSATTGKRGKSEQQPTEAEGKSRGRKVTGTRPAPPAPPAAAGALRSLRSLRRGKVPRTTSDAKGAQVPGPAKLAGAGTWHGMAHRPEKEATTPKNDNRADVMSAQKHAAMPQPVSTNLPAAA